MSKNSAQTDGQESLDEQVQAADEPLEVILTALALAVRANTKAIENLHERVVCLELRS